MITEEKLLEYRELAKSKLIQMVDNAKEAIEEEDYEEAIELIYVLNSNVISVVSINHLLDH